MTLNDSLSLSRVSGRYTSWLCLASVSVFIKVSLRFSADWRPAKHWEIGLEEDSHTHTHTRLQKHGKRHRHTLLNP